MITITRIEENKYQADDVVSTIPQLARGLVWCSKCGAQMKVDGGACLSGGWPKCCGETMTIDSPEERNARP